MSGLTTHVLDLTAGRPAGEVAVRLRAADGELLAELRTDADGRARLLDPHALRAGGFRLEFDIGPYFRRASPRTEAPGFLETVVIDFHVGDPSTHHHVPLLVSPFGYSTYRGS